MFAYRNTILFSLPCLVANALAIEWIILIFCGRYLFPFQGILHTRAFEEANLTSASKVRVVIGLLVTQSILCLMLNFQVKSIHLSFIEAGEMWFGRNGNQNRGDILYSQEQT